jgi:hypothetical protein
VHSARAQSTTAPLTPAVAGAMLVVATAWGTALFGLVRTARLLNRHAIANEWAAYAAGLEDGGAVHKWLQ